MNERRGSMTHTINKYSLNANVEPVTRLGVEIIKTRITMAQSKTMRNFQSVGICILA